MRRLKQSRICSWCQHRIRTRIPAGGDGSREVFCRHTRTGHSSSRKCGWIEWDTNRCEGSNQEAPLAASVHEIVTDSGLRVRWSGTSPELPHSWDDITPTRTDVTVDESI